MLNVERKITRIFSTFKLQHSEFKIKNPMNRPHLKRTILLLLGVFTWFFLFLSLGSFHTSDWPSHAVWPYEPIQNLCGSAGAFVAYWMYLILGQGIYPLLFFTGASLAALIMKNEISDLWLRLTGLAILCTAFAAFVHHFFPGSDSGLPEGQGGFIGITASTLLQAQFGTVGTRLVLLAAAIVGLLLAADDLLLHTPALVTAAASSIRNTGRARKNFSWSAAIGVPIGMFKSGLAMLKSRPKPKINKTRPVPVDDDEDLKPPVVLDCAKAAPALPPAPAAIAVHEPELSVVEAPTPAPRADIIVKLPNPNKLPVRTTAPARPKELGDYQLPPWDCLADAEYGYAASQEKFVREQAAILENALREFNIEAHVVEIDTGPVITMYEISLAPGIKVSAITALSNDIMRALKAESVRIVAPVPGKNTVGIEVPNAQKEKVRLKELMQLAPEAMSKMSIPLFLGKDASGEPLITDLAAMPHCLIAGTTGSGKSVCINSIITSILYLQRPDQVKLILVDPKMVEMAPFKELPHLMCPLITEAARATSVLEWACQKMDERYEYLAEAGVRNIKGYNGLTRQELIERFNPADEEEEARIPKKLPYIVILIDELADLMMTSGKEVEAHIVRLAQKSRAVGIHLILATQRPQANVVTGLIKSNMPSRIAFRVSSKMDSRIVLDQNGADLLLGQGDMLFLEPGASKPTRAQGTFIDDRELRESVRMVRQQAEAQYEPELVQIRAGLGGVSADEKDELFDDAVRIVIETKRGSVSLLQRRLTIGYGRAARLIEQMAASGILGDYKGSQAREVTVTQDEWEAMRQAQQQDQSTGMSV
jgi:DNA segregation ATPase FtsK/SpoIIIE, S-DNA-T family